jgi:hypothetical protein
MRSSFWNETTLRRLNKGKKTPMQLANERDIARFRAWVADLTAKWRTEDQQDQTRTNESEMNMTSEQKNKLRQLVHDHLQRTFRGYDKYEQALAEVLAKHKGEFGNTATVTAEFMNEHREGRPSPAEFRAEILREQRATGLSYTQAFELVCGRYPELQHPTLANDRNDTEGAGARSEQIQKLVREYCEAFGLDPKGPAYTNAFKRVLEMHPEIASAMHLPGRSNANTWRAASSDGTTPPSKYPQGQGVPGPAMTPPERAAKLAK